MKKKLLLLILCAIATGSILEARRGGRRGHRRGWHGRGRHHGGRHRGWGRGWWGGGYWGPSFAVTAPVVVDSPVVAQRPSSLDTFIAEFSREPYSAREFCQWIQNTGRSQKQCDLYRAYR